jgi:hypothetical protein
MRQKRLCFLALTVLMLSGGRALRGQTSSMSTGSAPTSGPRAEFLAEIAFYEQRYTRLAEAIPAAKYTWRPGRGSSFDRGSLRSHRSGELRHCQCFWPTATSRCRQRMFGRDTTQRGAFMMITGHTGEHLGQSIAYARMNGVVPPWTADAEQQKSADKRKP